MLDIAQILVEWGVSAAVVSFAFKQTLIDLAKDLATDWSKDLFKWMPKKALEKLSKSERDKAAGKAIKEFLAIFQEELKNVDVSESGLDEIKGPLSRFIKDGTTRGLLGTAFQASAKTLDIASLVARWQSMGLPNLPEDFDWEFVCKFHCRKAKEILRGSDELRKDLDSVNIERAAEAAERQAGPSAEFTLQKYRDGLFDRYANLKLESLDHTGSYYEVKLWNMFVPQNVRECQEFIPKLYEIPKEIQRRLRQEGQMGTEELREEEYDELKQQYQAQAEHPVLELVSDPQNQYLAILGDPGSGKSSLLQYLALEWAQKARIPNRLHPLPLLIELRAFARDCENGVCKDFLSFCSDGNVFCRIDKNDLHEWLKDGYVLAMFDGLDEVFDPARRSDVIQSIVRFSNDYCSVRIIVTSRVIGYKPQALGDAGFHHFMLQDLDDSQIEEFTQRWHELTYKDASERVRKRDRLKNSIQSSRSVRELAGNPLLLTMMAILNRSQELPRNRTELHNQASKVLLHQWDFERVLIDKKLDAKSLDYRDKQSILREVAYHMQSTEKGLTGNMIHRDDLERIISACLRSFDIPDPRTISRVLIERLRDRNFILCYLGADYYAFVHRTFLEYFCAWKIVELFGKRDLQQGQGLSKEALKDDIYGKHWQEEAWHEVLRLIAGMIDTKFVGEIIDYLMELPGDEKQFMNLFLAANCLADVRNQSAISKAGNNLVQKLKELITYDLSYYYAPQDHMEEKKVQEIRSRAIHAIAASWKEVHELLSWLKACVQNDDEAVRQAAVQEIARGWKDDPRTLPWLKDRALNDDHDDGYVRQAAVQEIARGWKEDPDTLVWLKD